MNRYDYAYSAALKAARPMGQVDFLETLDLCLRLAMESDDVETCITVARGVEMLVRFEHYCQAMDLRRGLLDR